jgi:hypothetical protein
MHLLRRIETYMKRTAITPTRFGRDAVGDPRFVFDLRNGREPGAPMCARVHAWLDKREGKQA